MSKSRIVITIPDNQGKPKNIKLGVNLPSVGIDNYLEKNLTQKPIFLEEGTNGTYGKNGNYVLFGDWPQSLKTDDITIDEKHIFSLNQWKCYKGNDNCYYVKQNAKPFNIDLDKTPINQFFSNGTIVETGKDYYFKVEPIKWRILDNSFSGGKLLLSEKILTAGCFDPHFYRDEQKITCRIIKDENIYPNNYKYSRIRAYLNGLNGSSYSIENYKNSGFLNIAFTDNAKNCLKAVNVSNGKSTLLGLGDIFEEELLEEDKNPYKYICKNTKDKVFLLSESDITNENYGFTPSDIESGYPARIKQATDYAIAAGIDSRNQDNEKQGCYWFLRTPFYGASFGCRWVSNLGKVIGACSVSFNHIGIAPAVCLIN